MRHYRAYTLDDVLAMYATAFFTLLSYAYRQQAKELLDLTAVASVPHMDKSERSRYIQELERASKAPEDLLIDANDYTGLEQLKRVL